MVILRTILFGQVLSTHCTFCVDGVNMRAHNVDIVYMEEATYMVSALRRVRSEIQECWHRSRSLTAVAIVMLAAFPPSLLGVFLDGRIVNGAPVWLKPAKFAISSAIYAGTLAWLFRYLQVWPRFVRVLGTITAAVLVIEVAIIDLQAARGTTSHFNVSSPLDSALWSTMGAAIGVLWLASIAILIALLRQRFADRGFGWALRLGMLITVVGSATGGLMVQPTEQQRSMMIQTDKPPLRIGSHTVGAPDGGPGLPGVGWSSSHGDLRVPHFLGLHGLQMIPILYWLRGRRRRSDLRLSGTAYAFATSASYLALVGIGTWQALRGQSLFQPDASTELALAIWALATGLTHLIPRMQPSSHRANAAGVY